MILKYARAKLKEFSATSWETVMISRATEDKIEKLLTHSYYVKQIRKRMQFLPAANIDIR